SSSRPTCGPADARPAECGPAVSGSRRAGPGGGGTGGEAVKPGTVRGNVGEAAGPSRRRVAETSQPLVDLVQAVGREVVAGGVRRAEERQVPPGGEDRHPVA